MRPDMKYIIIERPRTHGDGGKSIPPKGSKKRLRKQIEKEETFSFESNSPRRVYGWNCKELNENLRPLIRWLEKQVGRNWDDVYSEICQGLSVRNATSAHVRDHAEEFVRKDCTIVDGEICDNVGKPLGEYHWGWKEFYVHPESGKLCQLKHAPRYKYNRHKDWVPGKDQNHRYYFLEGVWYEITLKPYPVIDSYYFVWDMVISSEWRELHQNNKPKIYRGSTEKECVRRYGRAVYASFKRQLNTKEIRDLKLWESQIKK